MARSKKQPAKRRAKPARKSAKQRAKKPAKRAPKAKPARRPKAKPAKRAPKAKPARRAPKAKPAMPSAVQLARHAMDGDLEVLFGLVDGVAEGDRDSTAYKWLSVASDFGHEAADDMIEDLLEASSLRYDDDQLETGNAHWELGLAYLTGRDGLPRDLDKARSQLASANDRGYPMSVQGSDAIQATARASLAPDAVAVFDAVFSPGAVARIDDRGKDGDEES